MNKTIKRIISYVMIPVMLVSILVISPTSVFSAKQKQPYLTKDGERVSSIVLKEDEKISLKAEAKFEGEAGYCWQIQDTTQEDRWINIADEYGKELFVSYAVVGSMLDNSRRAYVRCKLTYDNVEHYTEPVEIQISYNVVEDEYIRYSTQTEKARQKMYATRAQEEHTTHTIVINYLFDNNGIAFEPYGASVAKGSDFSASITSPTVVGYAPFRRVGEEYVDASVVELDYKNIQSNITINVIYEPALVDFAVHHHLQNLLDDDYSIHYDLITEGKALTGSVVGDNLALTEDELPGFKALAYEKLTVAADGSTVVEIRYDRNYYLVDFDMNGGYGSEPVYTRYGATVGANNPIRHGYVFGGWELVSYGNQTPTAEQKSQYALSGGNTILVPAANLRYRAKWITQETEYTMVFWKENANDNGYSYWGYLDGLKAMSGSYVSGQDWIGRVPEIDDESYFTFNSEKTDKDVLVEGDGSTVVNVYYTRNYYRLSIKAKGKCTIEPGHQHTDACYDMICDLGHTHTEGCLPNLTCTQEEHKAHTAECIVCGKEEHIHGTLNCDCNKEEHTHVKACWPNVGAIQNTTPTNAPRNPVDGQIYKRGSTYYISIKGSWYRYSGKNISSGDIVDTTCKKTEHSHGTDCACAKENHEHSDTCYGDVLHTHKEKCYTYSCNAIEHVHVNACKRLKCGIPVGHTHNSTCNSSTGTNVVKIVYRKYQQSIEDIWPITDDYGKVYDDGQRWSPSDSSYYSQVLVYIAKMTPDDFTLTLSEANYDTFIMNYYLQVLPGNPYDVVYQNVQYKLDRTIKANYNYLTKAEDFFDITGFVQETSNPKFGSNNQLDITGGGNVDLYYKRKTDGIVEFNNNGVVIEEKTVRGVMYEAPLKDYNFEPEYPDNLEPNAYTFAGWYTSPGCFAGTEVNWDTLTMPEGDLLLYAKWAPITHRVRVFKDATLTEQIGSDQVVDHKAFAYAPTDSVVNGNYVFQGWFYVDVVNGVNVEKAFVFNGIPILEDMDVYAKWGSHVSVSYTINYVLKETGEAIADPTTGSAIAGHNKTFYAKAGDELYQSFQSGFYPLTSSHTVTMSVDGNHEFTFEYVYVESMPYKVQYIDSSTGNKLLEDKVVPDNNLSVVTETFEKKDGMMPDAYQKRLVLSASGVDEDHDGIYDTNTIIFYYTSDTEHAYYRVVHYIENIGANTYREYRSEELVGIIGEEYTVDALTLTGFKFEGEKTLVNEVLTPISGLQVKQTLGSDGMLIELFYKRQNFDYTVSYVDIQTGKDIVVPKEGSALFGEQVLEYAKDLSRMGYELVSENLKMLTITANEERNTLEFAYKEKTVSLKYQIVGPDGCGSLSQYSENVLAITGKANGSTPTIAEGFEFEGWYTDAACTKKVEESWIDNKTMRLTPVADGIWKEITYYAKFNAKVSELTIETHFTDDNDEKQAFIFHVVGKTGTDTEGVDLTVTVVGNSKVTIAELPIGEYTVTELTNWSWRYKNAIAKREITLSYDAEENILEYNNSRQREKWLDGNDVVSNAFQTTSD